MSKVTSFITVNLDKFPLKPILIKLALKKNNSLNLNQNTEPVICISANSFQMCLKINEKFIYWEWYQKIFVGVPA